MSQQRKVAAKVAASRTQVSTPARSPARSPADGREPQLAGPDVDPAFHRAILKVALELKKPSSKRYDEIVDATIRSMKLDAAAFRRYLGENGARNMNLLLATARHGGT
jgi:hypothetical protein